MDMLAKLSFPGILFVFTLAFGFWMSQMGKPYNGILFNIHKLAALAAVVLVVMQLSKMLKSIDSLALIIVLLAAAALCAVALFASGALMSLGKLDYNLTLTIHRGALAVLVIVIGLAAFWLGKQ